MGHIILRASSTISRPQTVLMAFGILSRYSPCLYPDLRPVESGLSGLLSQHALTPTATMSAFQIGWKLYYGRIKPLGIDLKMDKGEDHDGTRGRKY